MFAKETYIARRAKLKQTIGSGLLLFLGNDESGMNYADNTYHFRQDSTFLYFFGFPTPAVRHHRYRQQPRDHFRRRTDDRRNRLDGNTADAEGKERSSRYHRSTSVQGNRNLSEERAAERPAGFITCRLTAPNTRSSCSSG